MIDSIDAAVIGAGVVGLAVGRALAKQGLETLVLERNARIGEETSSRNSGVIHSGIYYPAGSLKAQLCARGRDLLYAYCEEKGIAHRRCGKLIVAQARETDGLRDLQQRALANGVTDLEWLEASDIRQLEPQVRAAAGLFCPSTGIIDVHELMTALQGDLEQAGGSVVCNSELLSATTHPSGFTLTVRSGDEQTQLNSRWLINSAGLHAVDLLHRIAPYPTDRIPRRFYAKGTYFDCRGASPFRHLVYPIPVEGGLGIHATLDLAGRVRFGPDVQWIDTLNYDVDATRANDFYAAIREYWPGLTDNSLTPSYAGIRPKLSGKGMPAADFLIETPHQHGVEGLINLLGIESPGLTSSLAIGTRLTQTITS